MKEECRQTLEQAYMLLDGEQVADLDRRSIQEHLEACAPCYERYGLEREVKGIIARLQGCTTCPDKLRERIAYLLEFDR
ncbi:MAG TPA: mycothiol system anti-sigma-R factor [Actinomycetota bacterium]|nr:mycothiol system anti-sigma-R factor [Actinomycetota bacterium]